MPLSVDACANALGIGVDAIDIKGALRACDELISSDSRGYVCVTGVHGVMESQSDPELRDILKRSYLTLPDGMPLVWVGHMQGYGHMQRVYGPDFMVAFCQHSVARGFRHFLYGGKQGIADELATRLRERFPGLQVVGTYTPPFRPLHNHEEQELIAAVTALKPDVVWVGLSTPKQERFMARYLNLLDTKLMVGVGAAFDIHTGHLKDAPGWMKSTGLQWLHRLLQEPGRLWKRYLVNNPLFLYRITLQLIGVRRYSL